MEGKLAAEGAHKAAQAPPVEEQLLLGRDKAMGRRLKEGARSKVRAAGEYTVLRTRQGISMFGEPSLGSLIKGGISAAKDESQQSVDE